MLYLRFISILAFSFAFAIAGCSGPTYVTIDGATSDSAPAPDGTIVLLSEPSLAIRPGEVATIDVRCLGPTGAPAPGVEVTFAIEGAALDSTLSTLSMHTNADGRASGGIVAGTSATSFRVRVLSHAAALPVYVDVGVGTSFGTLVVHAPYDGSRVVTRRIVDVVPRALCADLMASPPEVGARALPEGSDELSIAGLPTTVHYAVLARGESALARTASGCVDDVELRADETTRVDVPYADAPLGIDGRYAAVVVVDAHLAADVAFGALTDALNASTATRGGDATTMLDALQAELGTRVSPAAADTLAEARTVESLDHALEERLTLDASAPTALALRWIRAAGVAMAHPRIDATLVVAMPGASVITTDRVTVDDAADGTLTLAPMTFDPTMGVARSIVVRTDGTRDSVTLDPIALDAPLGAMLLAWMDAVAASDGLDGAAGLLGPACGTLRDFAASLPAAAACDEACVEAACATAVSTELYDVRTAAMLLDATASSLSLSGALAATDSDGDVRVDALRGEMAGGYSDGLGGTLGPVTGAIEVTRTTPPAP